MGEASSGVGALEAISQSQPEAVFLDIQMPELSGFDVLTALPTAGRPMIVFVTAYDRYALQAFEVSAVDYLLKPVTPVAVARAVDRLRDRGAQSRLTQLVTHLEHSQAIARVVGKRQHQFHVLSVESIEVFMSEHDVVFAVTATERFTVEKSLRELETLLDPQRFARVHKQAIVNLDNREGLEIAMGVSLPSRRVVRILTELVALHGRPSAVRVDNGPEFTAQPFVDWCAEHGVATHYIQPGKPDQNAYIERFNRSYRTEVLNAHLFESIAELRAITDAWLRIYNDERPHDSLGRVPPLTFLPRPSSAEKSPIELSA
jgi:DNA-binding LytR/AlgR family response regulator